MVSAPVGAIEGRDAQIEIACGPTLTCHHLGLAFMEAQIAGNQFGPGREHLLKGQADRVGVLHQSLRRRIHIYNALLLI